MARTRRHKHHSRKSRSNWAVMGAFVASAAFAPPLAAPAHATELTRRLESLRIAVPAETRARARAGGTGAGRRRSVRCASTFRLRRSESCSPRFERLSGVSIAITNAAIADISSPGVSGIFTPLEAIARAPRRHERHLARHRAQQRVARDSSRVRSGRRHWRRPAARASSPKYAQPLIEVPQTIEVIPREVMEAQGVTTLSDALAERPGHQPAGRRRRRRVEHVGRHVQPARLQRQQQPVRRWCER